MKRMHGNIKTAVALTPALLLSALAAGPVFADGGPDPLPIPRTKDLAYYAGLVNTVLPSFSSNVLTVANGPDWMAGKTVHQVAAAVMDSDPGTIVTSGPLIMGYDPPDGPRRILLDFADGYIRYTNRDRSFGASSPCMAVAATEADNALVATVGALGLPTTEWGARRVDTVMDRSVDGEIQDPPTEGVCEVERMVTMTRKASNGLPIFDSKVREAVSNLHQRARLLIDWPRFLLASSLLLRTRTEVVDDLAMQIWEAQRDDSGMGAEVNLDIDLGYVRTMDGFVPVARAAFVDIYDRYAGDVLYVPLALKEGSGVDQGEALAALQFRARVDALGGSALMEFFLPEDTTVRLAVVDAAGREVATIAEGPFSSGWHQVSWNLDDRHQSRVASGVYFARLQAGREASAQKLLVIH